MKRTSGLSSAALLTIAAAAILAFSPAAQPPVLRTPITLPFELVIKHVMLQVHVDKRPQTLSFVLDTGDKFAIIDLDRAKELGLALDTPVKIGGAGPELLTGAKVKESTFSLSGFPQFVQPLTLALPLKPLATRFGHDFDGILGADFIEEFVVEIDYAARHITLHDRQKFVYAGPGESIPVEVNRAGHPIVEAEVTPVGGQPLKGRFMIDIGSGGSLALHSPFVTEHRLPGPDVKTIRSIGSGGAGGKVTGRVGRVSALKIGAFTFSNPTALFSEDRAGAFASARVQGNIGQQIIGRFRTFLDYGRDRIILEPTRQLDAPFDRATSGVVIEAEGQDYKTYRVSDVLENSPATEAGLYVNDVITAVDDRPASQLTLTAILDMFERSARYRITVRRGDRSLALTLTPRQLV